MRRWIVLFMVCGACRVETSFKVAHLEAVEYDKVFEICHQQIIRSYHGVVIRADSKAGHIETDPTEFNTPKGLRREQAYVDLKQREEGVIEVAVFAPMFMQEIDPDAQPPVRWIALGSDAKQEKRLLEQILGSVLAAFPDARIDIRSQLPKE